jgi:quercetin dioxygenase-like cupin family protein
LRLLRNILDKQGWHVSGDDIPIQLGIKFGLSSLGKPHIHRTMHEYFLILQGSISLSVNGKTISLNKGDLLIVDPNESHEMLSKSDDAHYLLLMPKAVQNDKVEY